MLVRKSEGMGILSNEKMYGGTRIHGKLEKMQPGGKS